MCFVECQLAICCCSVWFKTSTGVVEKGHLSSGLKQLGESQRDRKRSNVTNCEPTKTKHPTSPNWWTFLPNIRYSCYLWTLKTMIPCYFATSLSYIFCFLLLVTRGKRSCAFKLHGRIFRCEIFCCCFVWMSKQWVTLQSLLFYLMLLFPAKTHAVE